MFARYVRSQFPDAVPQLIEQVHANPDAALLSVPNEPPLKPETLPPVFAPDRPLDQELAELLRSDWLTNLSVAHRGLLLLRNDEDEAAHRVVQTEEGRADADAVHAIMHRREADFGNARYWARIVSDHPIYDRLSEQVASVDGTEPARQQGRWSPMAFVDFCSQLDRSDVTATVAARVVSELEMRELREHLLNTAPG